MTGRFCSRNGSSSPRLTGRWIQGEDHFAGTPPETERLETDWPRQVLVRRGGFVFEKPDQAFPQGNTS